MIYSHITDKDAVKILLYLGIIVTLIFLVPQYADAITVTTTPRTAHFDPNDWLYIAQVVI